MRTLLFFAFCVSAFSQTAASVAPSINPQFTENSTGVTLPCVGCKLYSYTAGTLTPFATYTDYTGAVANSNPITLDSGGYTPSGIWIKTQCYKFILKTSALVTIWTRDQVCDNAQILGGSTGAAHVGYTPVAGNTTTVAVALNSPYEVFPQYFSGGTDSIKTDAAIAAMTVLGTGTVSIPPSISTGATYSAPSLSAGQNLNIVDFRIGRSVSGVHRFGAMEFWPTARDNSGGYASEVNVIGLQNPGFVTDTYSDGTATGFDTANYTSSFCHAVLGASLWCTVTDSVFKGSLNVAYRDWSLYQYTNGGSGSTALFAGIDNNFKSRFDFTPINFVQSSLAISSCSTATPMVVTFAVAHGIIGVNVPINISGSANTTCNGNWKAAYASATTLTLVGSIGPGSGSTGSGTALFSAGQQRATANVPRIQGGYESTYNEGISAELGITFAQLSGALYSGSHVYCTDCDVPPIQGAACTAGGSGTGAYVYYLQATAICFAKLGTAEYALDNQIAWNTHYNAGFKYTANGFAAYAISSSSTGGLDLYTAPSGTAGNAVTFTKTLSLSSDGRLIEILHTPASSAETCTAGTFTDDANYHYVCVTANTWKRAALSAF